MRAIVGQHLIAALHCADWRFQYRTAGVAEALAGQEVGLFADHTFAANFLDLAVRVGNHPVAGEQARGDLTFVADRDRVGKGVVAFFGLGLLADVVGADVDANPVRARRLAGRMRCCAGRRLVAVVIGCSFAHGSPTARCLAPGETQAF